MNKKEPQTYNYKGRIAVKTLEGWEYYDHTFMLKSDFREHIDKYSTEEDEEENDPQQQYWNNYTDGCGNCFSDADPGL